MNEKGEIFGNIIIVDVKEKGRLPMSEINIGK